MLLSEMFGVKRDKPFMVKGLVSVYKIGTDAQGIERIERVDEGARKSEVVYGSSAWRVIHAAPYGIIHLPPPLTDEQREQLKALYTLSGRWLAKDSDMAVNAFVDKPVKCELQWTGNEYFAVCATLIVSSLVSWSDPEPYDIGKALGYENKNNT